MADFQLITSTKRYAGLSTDTKPASALTGSLAKETDTGNEFIFNGAAWVPYSQPVSVVGSLANNQTNKAVTANTNILTANYTPTKYSKSVLQVMTNTAGVLSLVVDGVSGTFNSGSPLTANAWYEFEVSLLLASTYNLKLSVGATMQVKWQVI